jgi:FkbM family methyltransferase
LKKALDEVTAFKALSKIKAALVSFGFYHLPLLWGIDLFIKKKLFPKFYDDSIESIIASLRGIEMMIPQKFVTHYIRQDYEPVSKRAFLNSLRVGMTVIDVGAHIGFYSLIAAKKVMPGGIVHAVEPYEQNIKYLEHNITLNGLKNVTVHRFAAGAKRRKRTFHITHSTDSNGFYPHPIAETIETISIDEIPLDDIVTGPVHVTKIDVEGAEIEVLSGMKRILGENPRLKLFLEWNPRCMRSAGRDPLELPSFVKECGFIDIWVLDDAGRRIRPLDEVREALKSGNTPDFSHVNLYAGRLKK